MMDTGHATDVQVIINLDISDIPWDQLVTVTVEQRPGPVTRETGC